MGASQAEAMGSLGSKCHLGAGSPTQFKERASEYLVNDSKGGLMFSRARKGLASEHEKLEREE